MEILLIEEVRITILVNVVMGLRLGYVSEEKHCAPRHASDSFRTVIALFTRDAAPIRVSRICPARHDLSAIHVTHHVFRVHVG